MEHLLIYISWFILVIMAIFCCRHTYLVNKQVQKEQDIQFDNTYFNVNIAIVTAEINDQQYGIMRAKIWSLRQMKRANHELIDVLVAKTDRKFTKPYDKKV